VLLLAVACGGPADHPAPAAALVAPDAEASLELEALPDAQACVGIEVAAERLPVDLFAVLDSSSSMAEATSTGVSKWYATKTAFQGFLASAPSDMGFGLSLFPAPGEDSPTCAAQFYRDRALPISELGKMASGARAQLDAVVPSGQTPTGPALTAALELATIHALSHAERSVLVVLATDGLPTACAPTDTEALAELAREAFEGPGHVRTLVVALQPLTGATAPGFEQIARAGGTGRALSVDPRVDFGSQLSGALSATVERKVACDLALPEAPATERLDYDAINVVLDETDGRTTFPRVADAAGCSAAGGWYYDVDPNAGAPSRLNMCKASCERISSTAAKLRVELGCKTLVR
jgi:hypothetical protein